MVRPDLQRLIADASALLCAVLDNRQGALEPPIRSEIFGPRRFAQHGFSLGASHRAGTSRAQSHLFFPRLNQNILMLRQAQRYIGAQTASGHDISPAAEWLIDNAHLIEAQLKEIHEALPHHYFRRLPVLMDAPLVGLPRIYGVAWAFVAHTDSAFDEDLLMQFLIAYQGARELSMSEMWALPTTLRVVLIENLRRLAERVATQQAAREAANLCCDRIETHTLHALDELHALMALRGASEVFLTQMAVRLQDGPLTGHVRQHARYQGWLHKAVPDLAAMQAQQNADQTADNLSVSNAVTSLRAIGDADWSEIVAGGSALMQLMLGSEVFKAEHPRSRDLTLHAIEALARRSERSEVSVATTLLGLMRGADPGADPDDAPAALASHWLRGRGRPQLVHALGLREPGAQAWRWGVRHLTLPLYLGALLFGTLAVLGALMQHRVAMSQMSPMWLSVVGLWLMSVPASEAVSAVVNRLISESLRPRHLPRLALSTGIPPERRVMVVVPALLTDLKSARALVHRLELHELANPEPQAQFALLTDWVDADTVELESDRVLLDGVRQAIGELNARHARRRNNGAQGTGAPRFIVLHRDRLFSQTQQRWIGWERKRGKLELLIAALAQGHATAFLDLGEDSRIASGIQYVVTLDSDTQLPPGRLRELVGVAAHPDNQPRLSADGRRVLGGYAILQPRTLTPLPIQRESTLYHWLFAGRCGVDAYSHSSSEVYQDLFGEGTFNGKGLMHVHAMHSVLQGRIPEGRVLSHDLLEGAMTRCAAVTDITLIEDAPGHADVAASRVHRWTRGDWQLLPFMLRAGTHQLRAINLWKMTDNLRRTLVAPCCLIVLICALSGRLISPAAALALTLAAFGAGPLMGALAGFWPSRPGVDIGHLHRQAWTEVLRAVAGTTWHLAQLVQQSWWSLDAIVRALFRLTISHRDLLEWSTAESAKASAKVTLGDVLRQHVREPVVVALLLAGLWWQGPLPSPAWVVVLGALWLASPLWTWWVSRPRPPRRESVVSLPQRRYLTGVARDTWRFFERCVGPDDHHLPPDNLQTQPHDMLAHRTSPTNIGLYLLSAACARQFGWIGTLELLTRLEATLGSLRTLERHEGHFLNWYDTQTQAALSPRYVSTVDSGNLCGHLLAVSHACRELADAPFEPSAGERALSEATQRLAPFLSGRAHLTQVQRDELSWLLADHRATRLSAQHDAQAQGIPSQVSAASQRLLRLAEAFEQLAHDADFRFLFHPKRHLFHLGYRLEEQQLDAGFYDLLASESRLTGLWAIAKGDVPVNHWAALGRPFFTLGARVGLRSWSGSMFEYLMPGLVLREPAGSVLHSGCEVAVREQIAFGELKGVPWGISESAHAGRDHTLAYQYAPQGVPRLALRRTPADELVVAPYASVLATPWLPHAAMRNLAELERLGARGRFGFCEAIDHTPSRQMAGEVGTVVHTFMAHHQGMCIASLANALLDRVAQRWGMADAHIQAVSSLLHERTPDEVSSLLVPHSAPAAPADHLPQPGLLRTVVAGMSAIEPTHLLSNGRYQVALRANGAGWSRWGETDISRWRDDLLRDAHGTFVYLRWRPEEAPVSLTQHPAPDPSAHYQSTFHADRVSFEAQWTQAHASTTVWVSPEDDIEFRQVEVHNQGEVTLDIELMSAFEVALSPARADEAHPAFANLFVRARWLGDHQALLLERQPRLPDEPVVRAAHFLAEASAEVQAVDCLTERRQWAGRNQHVSQPWANFEDSPSQRTPGEPEACDTGLDPICALRVRLRIAPHAKALVTFATAASRDPDTLHALIDRYRQASHVQRASLMSATLASIRLHALRIHPEHFAAIQTLTTALLMTVTRPGPANGVASPPVPCDRRLLWRLGISGDRPIVLVSASLMQGLTLLRTLTQALRVWSWGGVACDLVVLNEEASSYHMALHHELQALRDRFRCDMGPGASASPPPSGTCGLHVLLVKDLAPRELLTLRQLARIHIQADGRPLQQHVAEWLSVHEQAQARRGEVPLSAVPVSIQRGALVARTQGRFSPDGATFSFDVNERLRPDRPWINVIANPTLGTHVSEAAGGHTWAVNSRSMQLTPWSNDPLVDPPGEHLLLEDLGTRCVWSLGPSSGALPGVTYRVTHGQGFSTIQHRQAGLEVEVTWCVDALTAVKQVHVRLVNWGAQPLRLRLIGVVEWVMGSHRAERSTLHTARHRQPLPGGRTLTALLCTQQDEQAGFGQATAFWAVATHPLESVDWSCDRRECFDARGRLVLPEALGHASGSGLDPCAALSLQMTLPPGVSTDKTWLLGFAANPEAACRLAAEAIGVPPQQRLQQAIEGWDALLGATTVKTPDPLFDALVNRWLLYQTVSCRLWAKAGLYQAGGATGYRDQLQDTLALSWAAPEMLRQQIRLCASRQFPQGDVQHWWHEPGGSGVRTRFSDDLLWLPHACTHAVRTTGDWALLDELVPFLEGPPVPPDAEDIYNTPAVSELSVSVYEHAARAIDHSLRVGVHGLPLMGTGDWNDGMNRVGHEGRGESVWLGWFLCRIVADFAPLARARGEGERARRWSEAAHGWRAALNDTAWDGRWFKRAYFDDGQPLGGQGNAEARIDLIAQAWSVLSGAGSPDKQRLAMASVEALLMDPEAGLIRLLHPPFAHARPSAGYIQAYPPGVRENGGQYSHAGVWALMAMAELARQPARTPGGHAEAGTDVDTEADTQADTEAMDAVYRLFTWLSPAHRAAHPQRGEAYGIEPYVMAGDVYSQPPFVGRGGWSWYTGSASWMHRAALESVFGLSLGPSELSFAPCLPSHWPRAELTLRRGERTMRFVLMRSGLDDVPHDLVAARVLQIGQVLNWLDLPAQATVLVPLPDGRLQPQSAMGEGKATAA